MKLIQRALLVIASLFFMAANAVALPQTFTLDPNHTYVLWRINHLGFSNQSGKWYADGTLTLDKDRPQDSKVDATIQLANLVTGLPELDKHLKDKLFFDVNQYPVAKFVSNKVEPTSKTTAKVYGMLSLHGVTKPVVLDVTFNQEGKNPINDKETVGFTATTTLKRSDFNITAFLPKVGDEVTIDIEAEAYKKE